MHYANPNSLHLVFPQFLHLTTIFGYTADTVISTGFNNPLLTVLYRVNYFVFTAFNISRLGFQLRQFK
jgi:hypothetical protein